MDRFEYVMVLISIIIGLSIAHMLLGIGGLIDRKAGGRPIKLSLAHGFWLAYVFIWTIQFWWWEYRFSEIVSNWTLGLYFFLVTYAMSLFLLAIVLVPRTQEGNKPRRLLPATPALVLLVARLGDAHRCRRCYFERWLCIPVPGSRVFNLAAMDSDSTGLHRGSSVPASAGP